MASYCVLNAYLLAKLVIAVANSGLLMANYSTASSYNPVTTIKEASVSAIVTVRVADVAS
jgi:hypothetical protein